MKKKLAKLTSTLLEKSGQLEQITYQWGPSIHIGTSS